MYTAQGTIENFICLNNINRVVRRIALQMIAKLPASVELDDLIQAGMLGLLDASSRYQDNKGAQFETFVSQRIRGAMLDELRASDGARAACASRRAESRRRSRRSSIWVGSVANEGEIAKELKIDLEAYQSLLQEIQGCQLVYVEDFAKGEAENPFLDLHAQQARKGQGQSDDPLEQLLESGLLDQPIHDVTFTPPPGDAAAPPRLVAAGRADVAITYQPDLMLQIKEGLPVVRFGTLIETPLNSLIVLKDGPIKSLADLKGKTIGYSIPASRMPTSRRSCDRGADRRRHEAGQPQLQSGAAVAAGQVDAVMDGYRNVELIQLELEGHPPWHGTRRSTVCRPTTS